MKQVEISIIVTVYNIEKYIKRCIDSIIKQDFEDYEILLINDGSQDNSERICEYYSKKYTNIHYFKKINEGVSKARNYGLDKAKGKYVCFFDGDDLIKENYLLNLYEIMKNNNLELLITNCCLYPSMEIKYHQYTINEVMSGINLLNTHANIHTNNDLSGSWRMVYDKQFLKKYNLYYNEKICYGEDTEFNLRSFVFAKKAMAVNLAGYCYDNTREDSAMHLKYKKNYEESMVEQYKFRKNRYNLSSEYDNNLYLYYLKSVYFFMIQNQKSSGSFHLRDFKRINDYIMFTDAREYFGYNYPVKGKKEKLFYILFKLKLKRLLYYCFKLEIL